MSEPHDNPHDKSEMWQGEDIYEHEASRKGGWRLKVCQLTMDVLVCMAGIKNPYTNHARELPGQVVFDGEPWVSEFVAFVTLSLLDDPQDVVGLYSDICVARHQALGWLRDADQRVSEGARSAQEHYDSAMRGLNETQKRLGLAVSGPPLRLPS